MRYLYMKQIIIVYCRYGAASHAKQAVLIPKPVLFMLCPGLCCTLENNFLVISKFDCWWGMFILLQTNIEPWIPGRSWAMTVHGLFEWAFTSYNQVISCKQFVNFFLDRWEMFVLHPSTKISTAVKHFWILLIDGWSCSVWMRWYKLQPGP